MIDELTKTFFDTFEIEPMLKGYSQVEDNWHGLPVYSGEIKYFNSFEEMNKAEFHSIYDNEENEEDFKEYPPITDTHYLKLICLITKELNYFTNFSTDYEYLKAYILKEMILCKEDLSKRQVQELFKEWEDEPTRKR